MKDCRHKYKKQTQASIYKYYKIRDTLANVKDHMNGGFIENSY